MPDKNEILISAKFDLNSLKEDIKILAKNLREQIKSQFEGSKINISSAFQPVKIKLDLSFAQEQIQKWQDGLRVVIPVVPGIAPSSGKYSATERTATTRDVPVDLNKQLQIADKLTQSYSELDVVIKGLKITEPLFTKNLTELTSVRKQLRDLANKDATDLTDKDVKKYETLSKSLGRLGSELTDTKTKVQSIAPEIEKDLKKIDVAVKDNALLGGRALTFQLGVVGFGLQTLSGQFTNLAQSIANFANNTSQAIEPLERIRNLVIQDSTKTPEEKSLILETINKIADMPGSNLDGALKAFRSINSVGLQTAETLQLVEGLTKATARAGTGGEGLERIANQIRQFKTSGIFTAQDVRPIIEQGGRDITEIFAKRFGSVDAEALAGAGANEVIKSLIEGLREVDAPLATTSDRVNRLTNSFTRMRAVIGEIVSPGLDLFLGILKTRVEPVIQSISVAFKKLNDSTKEFIGSILIITPVVLGVSGAILSFLGIITLSFAILGRTGQLVGAFARNIGLVEAEVTGFAVITGSITKLFGNFAIKITDLVGYLLELGRGSALVIGGFEGLFGSIARVLGLTTPLGIAINLILAYATNIGKFRDSVNEGFGEIYNSFSKLFTSINNYIKSEGGQGLISFLSFIIDLIGELVSLLAGAVGQYIEGILVSIAQVVDVITSFFEIFNAESLSQLGSRIYNFFASLLKAIFGLFTNWINLMASSIVNKLADLFEPISSTVAKQLRIGANELRSYVIPVKELSSNMGKVQTSTEKSTSALKNFNNGLREANTLTQTLKEEIDKIGLELAKSQSRLQLQQARYDVSGANAKRDLEINKIIRENPQDAEKAVNDLISSNLKANLTLVNKAAVEGIAEASKAMFTQLANLNEARLPKDLSGAFGNQFDFENKLRGIAQAAKDGSVSFQDLKNKITLASQAGQELVNTLEATQIDIKGEAVGTQEDNPLMPKIPGVLDKIIPSTKIQAKNKEQQDSFKKSIDAYKKEVSSSLEGLNTVLRQVENRDSEVLRVQNESAQERIKRAEEIRQALLQLAAIGRTTPIKYQIEVLDEIIQRQEEALANAKELGDSDRAKQINDDINLQKQRKIQLTDALARASQVEKNAIQEAQISQDTYLNTTKQNNEALKSRLDLLKELIRVNSEAFVRGAANITKYEQEIKKLQTRFDSSLFGSETAIGRKLFDNNTNILFPGGVDTSTVLDIENTLFKNRRQTSGDVAGRTATIFDSVNQLISGKSFEEFKKNLESFISSPDFVGKISDIQKNISTTFTSISTNIEAAQLRVDDLQKQLEKNPSDSQLKTELQDALEQQAKLTKEAQLLGLTQDTINKILTARTSILDSELEKSRRLFEYEKSLLDNRIKLLELDEQINNTKLGKINDRKSNPKSIKDVIGNTDEEIERQLAQSELKVMLLKEEYDLRIKTVEQEKAEKEASLRASGATTSEITQILQGYDSQIEKLQKIRDLEIEREQDNNKTEDTIFEIKTGNLEKLYDYANSGAGIIRSLKKLIMGATGELGEDFDIMGAVISLGIETATTAVTGFFESLANGLASGENPLKNFKKFMGDLLITIGSALIKLAAAAIAVGIIRFLFGDVTAPIMGAKAAAVGLAAGVALVVAGRALGGGGASQESTTNATNSANASAGASTQAEYDPEKDPKLIYQKALLTQVVIDIRHDDGMIVKKVIKAVNRDSRLGNLIGNERVGFVI